MSDLTKEMNFTGLLTVQEIDEVHKTLMKGLKEAEKCGNLRDSEVYRKNFHIGFDPGYECN